MSIQLDSNKSLQAISVQTDVSMKHKIKSTVIPAYITIRLNRVCDKLACSIPQPNLLELQNLVILPLKVWGVGGGASQLTMGGCPRILSPLSLDIVWLTDKYAFKWVTLVNISPQNKHRPRIRSFCQFSMAFVAECTKAFWELNLH